MWPTPGASSSRAPTSRTSRRRSSWRSSTTTTTPCAAVLLGAELMPTYLTVLARRVCVPEVVKRFREAELGHSWPIARPSRARLGGRRGADLAVAEEVERMLADLSEREANVIRLYHLKLLNYRQIGQAARHPRELHPVGPDPGQGLEASAGPPSSGPDDGSASPPPLWPASRRSRAPAGSVGRGPGATGGTLRPDRWPSHGGGAGLLIQISGARADGPFGRGLEVEARTASRT